MKFLTTLATLLVLLPTTVLAEGGYHDSGSLPEGCGQAFFGGIVFLISVIVLAAIYDTYKMKTDPGYRARSEQIRREYDERRNRH